MRKTIIEYRLRLRARDISSLSSLRALFFISWDWYARRIEKQCVKKDLVEPIE